MLDPTTWTHWYQDIEWLWIPLWWAKSARSMWTSHTLWLYFNLHSDQMAGHLNPSTVRADLKEPSSTHVQLNWRCRAAYKLQSTILFSLPKIHWLYLIQSSYLCDLGVYNSRAEEEWAQLSGVLSLGGLKIGLNIFMVSLAVEWAAYHFSALLSCCTHALSAWGCFPGLWWTHLSLPALCSATFMGHILYTSQDIKQNLYLI